MEITTKTNHDNKYDSLSDTLDSSWLKSTFIIKDSDIVIGNEYSQYIRKNRYSSTADFKFTSTAPGMSMAVNPKPQYTRYCDIRRKGKLASRPDVTLGVTGHHYGLGMGRYYSEAIDDPQQRIFLRFGVLKYMPLLLWISKAFDIDKVVLQNRGVITSTMIQAIGIVAKFFAVAAAPLIALGMFAIKVYVQNSRFCSVKDTMYIYWSTVENILNGMIARRTLMPLMFKNYSFKIDNKMSEEQRVTSDFLRSINEVIPDIVDAETGRVSVFAVALRSQAAFNKMMHDDFIANQQKSIATDFTGYQDTSNTSHDTYFTNNSGDASFFTKRLFEKAYGLLISGNIDEEAPLVSEGSANQTSLYEFDPAYVDEKRQPLSLTADKNNPSDESVEAKIRANVAKKQSTFDKYKEYMLAELSEGGAFAVFNVESTGSVGESFSNSITSNPVESVFNALSSKARNLGNMLSSATDIPVVADVMKLAADTGATILSNASFGIANPLLALAYGVNVSMPKIWEESNATLPRASYKIRLFTPYGNAYSQIFNIYLPLAMILAGSLPRSTGGSTHTSPFYCQLFDRGRINSAVSMITNVAITRGVSNLAFSKNGHTNAVDVDIEITNMDEVIAVDVNSSTVLTKYMDALSTDFSDTPFSSYLNTITGVDVYTQVYNIPRIRLKLAERMMVLKTVTNPDPAAMAAFTTENIPFSGLAKILLGNNQAALQSLTNS